MAAWRTGRAVGDYRGFFLRTKDVTSEAVADCRKPSATADREERGREQQQGAGIAADSRGDSSRDAGIAADREETAAGDSSGQRGDSSRG